MKRRLLMARALVRCSILLALTLHAPTSAFSPPSQVAATNASRDALGRELVLAFGRKIVRTRLYPRLLEFRPEFRSEVAITAEIVHEISEFVDRELRAGAEVRLGVLGPTAMEQASAGCLSSTLYREFREAQLAFMWQVLPADPAQWSAKTHSYLGQAQLDETEKTGDTRSELEFVFSRERELLRDEIERAILYSMSSDALVRTPDDAALLRVGQWALPLESVLTAVIPNVAARDREDVARFVDRLERFEKATSVSVESTSSANREMAFGLPGIESVDLTGLTWLMVPDTHDGRFPSAQLARRYCEALAVYAELVQREEVPCDRANVERVRQAVLRFRCESLELAILLHIDWMRNEWLHPDEIQRLGSLLNLRELAESRPSLIAAVLQLKGDFRESGDVLVDSRGRTRVLSVRLRQANWPKLARRLGEGPYARLSGRSGLVESLLNTGAGDRVVGPFSTLSGTCCLQMSHERSLSEVGPDGDPAATGQEEAELWSIVFDRYLLSL